MINNIIDGISIALNNEFNPNGTNEYAIYDEEVEQGLKTPCFFINVLNPSENLFRGNRYKEINQFCVQFVPNDSDCSKKHTCNEIRERLFSCLEYITIQETDGETNYNSLIRGNKMHGEYCDGILSFYVNYDMFVKKKAIESSKMGSFDYNSNITKG